MNFKNIPWNDINSFGQKTMFETKLFSVSWILGRFCNYNCSYCWPYARTDIPDHQDFKIYTNTIDEIKKQARQNGFENFHFSFSGGEPTAYKRFDDLIKYYANDDVSYQSFHMTSNCSPGLRWWQKIMPTLKRFNRTSITASYHAEFADEDQFKEKLLYLIESGIYVTINQVMVLEKFFEYLDRCQRFYDSGIPVTLKPQSNVSASAIVDGYTDEMLNIMQTRFLQPVNQIVLRDIEGNMYDFDQAERFNAFGFNKFRGWSCNSGYQSVVIRGNEVKRSYSCSDEILGTLDTSFKLFSSSKCCITNSCVSSADSKIPKCKLI